MVIFIGIDFFLVTKLAFTHLIIYAITQFPILEPTNGSLRHWLMLHIHSKNNTVNARHKKSSDSYHIAVQKISIEMASKRII